MKGERIIAELLSIVGLLVYGVMIQHLYAELFHEPEKSWVNQTRAWWVTRGSRKMATKLALVWNRPDSSLEPTPGE